MYNYDTIKDIAGRIRDAGGSCKVTDLIALAAQNDPFYVGTDTDCKNGQWFADLWGRFGYTDNIHLRRVHYQIVSQKAPVLMPNGDPYENTLRCWNFLEQASKAARYLELIDPKAFTDRRNPDPHLFAEWLPTAPAIEVYNPNDLYSFEFPEFPHYPRYEVSGYDAVQRYHLEIWCEKSTMNDVLMPLCQRYGVNLVTGVGEQSITSTIQLVQRAIDSGKPVRVFYVSDFDPAGRSMPVAVARKTEYYIEKYDPDIDFRLFPVILTEHQCQMYALPRTPIKTSEKRKGAFEDQFGTGATELDALEALHPGALVRILQEYILTYYDTDLWSRVRATRDALIDECDDVRADEISNQGYALQSLYGEYCAIKAEFEERMAKP